MKRMLGSTPLDKVSVRHIGRYLTAHNNHETETAMPQARSEPASGPGPKPSTTRHRDRRLMHLLNYILNVVLVIIIV
jgi:hypothetical protein